MSKCLAKLGFFELTGRQALSLKMFPVQFMRIHDKSCFPRS